MRSLRLIIFFLLILSIENGYSKNAPVAKFSFNSGSGYDEVNGRLAKLVGVNCVNDRFGNDKHAIFVFGNESSYANLGTSKELKQKKGSISLWVKIEYANWVGKGAHYNPIIITKNTDRNDYYESYAMYYLLETKHLVSVLAEDSTRDMGIFTEDEFILNQWHHLVSTFNENYFSFYLDGRLQQTLKKNFEVKYLETDSVLLGTTANKKNNRWMIGAIDDVEFYDRVLTAAEVEELYRAPNPNRNRIILNWSLAGVALVIFIILIFIFIKRQVKKGIIKEKQELEQQNKLLETELRVNRASMNPHFIFNSLNALHNLILNKDIGNASDYLLKFSKLIRKTLDSNSYDIISLEFEIELLERYLELENLRFKENIKYSIHVDDSLVISTTQIPVMMLQPFVENSIWHGLLDKEGEKVIRISFERYEEKYVYCKIEDNGLGRKENTGSSFGKKSLATNFIFQRLDLLNRIHNLKCSLSFEDKPDGQGTLVKIILPILNT